MWSGADVERTRRRASRRVNSVARSEFKNHRCTLSRRSENECFAPRPTLLNFLTLTRETRSISCVRAALKAFSSDPADMKAEATPTKLPKADALTPHRAAALLPTLSSRLLESPNELLREVSTHSM